MITCRCDVCGKGINGEQYPCKPDIFEKTYELVAESEEEPAEWIVDTDDSRRWDRVRFYCSACNGWNTYGKSKYCPNCGAKMEVSEEDE